MASTADAGVSPAIAGYSNDSKRSLGSAPDRGELFTYQKSAAVLRHGAYTLRPIALSEEHAIRGVATGMMTIPAPDGSEIKIRYDRHEESPDGNWSWIGRVVGGDQAREAVFTFGEHGVFGSIPQLTGPSLQLTTERGIAYMVQADPTKLFRASRKGGDTKTRVAAGYDASSMREADSLIAGAMHKATEQASVSPKAFTASNTIDLVAGYSNGLATRLGGASVAVTKLNNLVAIGNVALQNSKVNARIRLVHALQVNYADNTLNDTALDQLTGHDGAAPVTIPAALAPLRAARDQYGADLATLVRDFKSENDGCGIAWLNGANGVAITAAKDAPFGYSVVSEGQFVDANGNTNYCEDISLVHELAHNMGSAHDIANAGEDTGRYPYSYGYKTTAAQGNFFTVMAYGDNNQTLYRVFSNPAITTCGGLACGVANAADNARSLSQTIPIVATFRSTIVPVGIPARTDVNGNGRSDMLWRNADGRLSYWLMTGSAINFSSPSVAQNPAYKMVATGDFTGDGRTDIVWQSPANVVLWTAGTQTNPLFTASTIAATPAGWSIVGSADMNGDGKADLLWRNTASGKFSYWLMNGSAIVSQTPSVVIPTAYKLVAIGDFNGDGIGDLVWDNNVAVWSWVNNNNGTFTQKQITAHPAGWGIVGAGDISGDGKSDLLWRNTSTGNFSYWVMNGAVATTKSASLPVTTAYKLSAIGDFNGDGRADLVWDNNVSVWLWSAPTTGTAFPQSRVANHPAGWTLQDPPGL